MNSLSWMIYAADVLGNLGVLFFACAMICGIAVVVLTVVFSIAQADGDMEAGSWKKPAWFLPLAFIFALLAALSPSSSTIYMIAASEAGEAVVTSPDGKAMLDDLKSIIRKKLKEELGSESKAEDV